jgi:hypothetical protein
MTKLSLDEKRLRLLGRRPLRRVAIAVTAPALALTGFALSSATPAYAASSATAASGCPQFSVCTWQNALFRGTEWNFTVTSSQPGNHWWYVGNAQNDQISSIINTHTATYAWFDKNCPATSPDYATVAPLNNVGDLGDYNWRDGTPLNDSISAWAVSNSLPAHGGC